MKFEKLILIGAIITILIFSIYIISSSNSKDDINDIDNEYLVKTVLENNGYKVTSVEYTLDGYGTYAYVIMISEATELQIAEQIGYGFGSLYVAYPDSDMYQIVLTSDYDSCVFSVYNEDMSAFVNGESSIADYLTSINTLCASDF